MDNGKCVRYRKARAHFLQGSRKRQRSGESKFLVFQIGNVEGWGPIGLRGSGKYRLQSHLQNQEIISEFIAFVLKMSFGKTMVVPPGDIE